VLRSVFQLLSGNAIAALMGFARNILVARLLGVEDYGIAATFALSTALIEMATTLGLEKLIVQAREGDEPEWQAGLQGFHLIRSILAALVLFALAQPTATFFGVPDLAWAYRVMALVPLFLGFEHFDIHRLTRHKLYRPFLMHRVLPLTASVAAIWPLVWLFGDYRVLLYAHLIQYGLSTVVSHAVAERRYQLSFDRAIIGRALSFGWPLLINNALLFAVMEGDRVIVGRELGLEALAIFSIGLTLTRMPIGIITQSLSLFFLPRLSAAQDDPIRFAHLSCAVLQTALVSGLLLVLMVALIGGPIVSLLFGDKYAALLPFLIWFAIWQAVRGFRAGVSQIMLARGGTRQLLLANIVRIAVIPLAWWAAAHGATFLTLIVIATTGEIAAFGAGLAFLKYRSQLSLRAVIRHITLAFVFLLLVAGFNTLVEDPNTLGDWQWARFLIIIPFAAIILSMREIVQPLVAYARRKST
jgi:O-antigen/teichoic acid export membrane protein